MNYQDLWTLDSAELFEAHENDLPFTDEPFPSEMVGESPAPEHRYQLGERLIATQFNVPRVVEVIGLPADPRQLYKVQGLSSSFTWYCPVEHLHPYWPKESILDVIKKIIEWGFELRMSTLPSGARWVQVSIPFEVSIAISGGTLEELLPLEQFVRQLRRAGRDLVPGLSNGSYTARKQAQRQPSLAGQAALLILILAWLVLATFGRSPVVAAAPTAMKRESRIEMVSGEVLEGRSILVNLGESVWVLEV